jgi:lipid-A-disaccharide synthase
MPPRILISAGEASSDMYAARLATALRERTGAEFFGMGGPRMAAAGVELIADYHDVAVVGVAEVVHKIPTVVNVQNRLAREAARRNASLAILVDSPGTHLGVARRLKNRKIPVGCFIGPQIWAWRPGRIRLVKRLVNHMVVIFPFEEPIYRKAGVRVDFVGHPLVDIVKPTITSAEFAVRHRLDPARPMVALLPGSRRGEIARHYPILLRACELLVRDASQGSAIQFVLSVAPNVPSDVFEAHEKASAVKIVHVAGAHYDVLASADCAAVASGTATVEASLLGTPMILFYRVSGTTAAIVRHMLKTPFIGMVNLIAERGVVPELVQDGFTPERSAAELRNLLESPQAREEMKTGLAEVRQRLGVGGAIERAADVFSHML